MIVQSVRAKQQFCTWNVMMESCQASSAHDFPLRESTEREMTFPCLTPFCEGPQKNNNMALVCTASEISPEELVTAPLIVTNMLFVNRHSGLGQLHTVTKFNLV